MQEKLFNIPPKRIPRPTIENINFEGAYLKMANDIVEWENDDSESIEDTSNHLKKIFSPKDLQFANGYEIARELESSWGLDPDTELVNTLDQFSHYIYTVISEAEKKWVIDCNIKPSLPKGKEVVVEYKGKKYTGTILSIYSDKAEYVINVPELGHVGEGEIGTQGLVYHFENLELDFFDEKHWKDYDSIES